MNKQLPIIYLHIGTIKTGTTSLQNFFHLNRSLLKTKYNIYYPTSPGLKNHTNLPLYAYDKNIKDIIQRKKIINENALIAFRKKFKERFIKEIRPHIKRNTAILLSNEHLSGRVQEVAEVKKLLSLFDEFDVQFKAIIYLRRQDKMMLSTYSTWVKNGGKWKINPKAYKNKRYDYVALLDLWAGILGKENLIVRPFEKSKLKNGDLYEDFCNLLNINSITNWQKPNREKLNASLDQVQLQFLSAFNKYVPVTIDNKKNVLRGDIVKYLEESSSYTKLDLPYEEKQKIAAFFEKDNQLIASMYLPNKSQSLFDPIPEIEEEDLEEQKLTREKAIKIAAYLWTKQQQEINQVKWYYKLMKFFRLKK